MHMPILGRRAVRCGAAAAVVALCVTTIAAITDRPGQPTRTADSPTSLAVHESYQDTSAQRQASSSARASAAAASGAAASGAASGVAGAAPSQGTSISVAAAATPTSQSSSLAVANAPAAQPAHATPAPTTSSAPSTSAGSGSSGTVSAQAIEAVFSLLNSERAANGLPALHLNADLTASAHTHNLAMAAANTLSHQLPGEADPFTRMTNAGYKWSAAAENIGETSVTNSSGALDLETSMYGEQPPNDGHRLNILGPYVDVGIDVIIDSATGLLWLTEDFGAPL
jgi:uncharacterized protein YkwD